MAIFDKRKRSCTNAIVWSTWGVMQTKRRRGVHTVGQLKWRAKHFESRALRLARAQQIRFTGSDYFDY